jgi:hypothetical protein
MPARIRFGPAALPRHGRRHWATCGLDDYRAIEANTFHTGINVGACWRAARETKENERERGRAE